MQFTDCWNYSREILFLEMRQIEGLFGRSSREFFNKSFVVKCDYIAEESRSCQRLDKFVEIDIRSGTKTETLE